MFFPILPRNFLHFPGAIFFPLFYAVGHFICRFFHTAEHFTGSYVFSSPSWDSLLEAPSPKTSEVLSDSRTPAGYSSAPHSRMLLMRVHLDVIISIPEAHNCCYGRVPRRPARGGITVAFASSIPVGNGGVRVAIKTSSNAMPGIKPNRALHWNTSSVGLRCFIFLFCI